MIVGVKAKKYNNGMNKAIKDIKSRLSIIVAGLVILFIIFSIISYISEIISLNEKDAIVVSKISLNSLVIGVCTGVFMCLFVIFWYNTKIIKQKQRDFVKSYARIFRADMDRSKKLFRNKRFELMKISSITIMQNWLECFGYISAELSVQEIQELVNYYSKIEKLKDYEMRINSHLERMQCYTLKTYPYMKEYKELVAIFTFEINNLFKVKIEKLDLKLNYLCK